MNSYTIAQTLSAVRATVARLQAENPDTDADALLALVETEEPAFNDMLAALCRAADEAKRNEDAADMRADALRERAGRYQKQYEAYRALIFAALDAAGQRAWKSPEFTVSVTPGRAGVVITDPAAIPDDFVRIKREPDKTAIGAALASGATVPGAEQRNGFPTLIIRTK